MPNCPYCGEQLENDEPFVGVTGGTIHGSEPQNDAGGGSPFHPPCAVEYIKENYSD